MEKNSPVFRILPDGSSVEIHSGRPGYLMTEDRYRKLSDTEFRAVKKHTASSLTKLRALKQDSVRDTWE